MLPYRINDFHTSASRALGKGKCSPYWIAERRVLELIPVLGSQPAGDVGHKPGGRLPLLVARPAVTPGTSKRAAVSFTAWRTSLVLSCARVTCGIAVI